MHSWTDNGQESRRNSSLFVQTSNNFQQTPPNPPRNMFRLENANDLDT